MTPVKFVVVSKKDCPYCIEAKNLLLRYGQHAAIYNTEESPIIRQFVKELCYTTVPQIWVNTGMMSWHLGGYADLKEYLSEKYPNAVN